MTRTDVRGPVTRVTLECPFPLIALITTRSLEEMGISEGVEMGARVKATAVHLMGI